MKRLIVSFVAAFMVLTLVSQTIPENAKNYIERFSGIAAVCRPALPWLREFWSHLMVSHVCL